ncbi:MAG: hypothetical protein GTO63_09215 [Anaerolineae bacterium]|nr:hypothetical protein [Anaerolineae bacterium]NIN95067.1 hypothetical protein [Anaerolineae bacterium]NIQ78106.1 hypothetical protein [Anaerolineae bacterium]
MTRDPQRMAWIVLLVALVINCTLLISIPLAVRWYLINATVSNEATLEVITGTVLVYGRQGNTPIGVTSTLSVPEGSTIRTDSSSRAFLTFFDNSTAVLSFDTEVRLAAMHSSRFRFSPTPDSLLLDIATGQVNIGVALPVDGPVEFLTTSPHMAASLTEGSYSLKVTPDSSRTIVHLGTAEVTAQGSTVTLEQKERTTVRAGERPEEPLAAAQNLLVNGSFEDDLSVGWEAYNEQGGDGGDVDGEISLVQFPEIDSQAVRFSRTGSEGNHCETVIRQDLNEEISDLATSVRLYFRVRLVDQSLSGGGYLSSEYPLMIRLEYEDVYGSASHWTHGLYYQNRDNNPTMYGERIPRNVWYDYESDNLLETIYPRPARLQSLLVYASGWDYESMVTDISLVVE